MADFMRDHRMREAGEEAPPKRELHAREDRTLDRASLWDDGAFSVSRTTWERGRHPSDRESRGTSPGLVVMREGSYVKELHGETVVADPMCISLYNTADQATVQHPKGERTVAAIFMLQPEIVSAVLEDIDPEIAKDPHRPFRAPSLPLDGGGAAFVFSLLRSLEEGRASERVATEEALLDLVRWVFALDRRTSPRRRRAFHGERLRGKIPEVRHRIAASFMDAHSLGAIASGLGCSSWHLSRVFADETGVPLSRFLLKLRVQHALPRVLDGVPLTEVALDCGFSSHSHLTNAFRREFGVPPRSLRGCGLERARRFLRVEELES